jgi:prepilin-type N-terminal cleavage/methylation domain-containing protein
MRIARTVAKARRRAGYTLVELMMALSIFGFSSAAVSSLMFATYNTNRHVKGMVEATSASEITLRRIVEVTRSATDLQYISSSTGLYIQTPPDSSNLSYIFIYYTKVGLSGRLELHEKIETAGSLTLIQDNVIVDNIQSFNVTRKNPGVFPENYEVSLVLNATPVPISRTVRITGRNHSSYTHPTPPCPSHRTSPDPNPDLDPDPDSILTRILAAGGSTSAPPTRCHLPRPRRQSPPPPPTPARGGTHVRLHPPQRSTPPL